MYCGDDEYAFLEELLLLVPSLFGKSLLKI
jgi:hypothetical protein